MALGFGVFTTSKEVEVVEGSASRFGGVFSGSSGFFFFMDLGDSGDFLLFESLGNSFSNISSCIKTTSLEEESSLGIM